MRLHRLEREQMVRLPVGELGDGLGMPVVRRDLARIFDYRQAAVARLLG